MRRPLRSLAVASLALALAWLAVAREPEQKKEETGPRILSPLEGSTVLAGLVDCVVRAEPDTTPTLRVDGQETPWALATGTTRFARPELAAGQHEIAVGDKSVRFTVTDDKESPDLLRAHSRPGDDAKACGTCHEVTEDDPPAVGALREPDACLECHTPTAFDLAHFHPVGPLRHCGGCHALHGSARKGLLRAPASELCAQCHD